MPSVTLSSIIASIGTSGVSGFSGYSGSGFSGFSGGPAGWTRITTSTTAVANNQYIADTSGGAFNLTLPASPSAGAQVVVQDGGNFATNNLTILRNGSTIEGISDNLALTIAGLLCYLTYDGTTWQVVATAGPAGQSGTSGYSGLNASKTLAVLTHAASTTNVSVSSTGILAVTNHAGSTVNVQTT